ncbi:MAG: methyl-accepting chemotaxis protein, partial [Methylomonas sp.]
NAASVEQSSGIGQINDAMRQLDKVTQQNAASAEELAATAEELSGQAAQLQDLVSFFKVDSSRKRPVTGPNKSTFTQPRVSPKVDFHKKPIVSALDDGSASEFDDNDFERF